jgi:hypothetical protein
MDDRPRYMVSLAARAVRECLEELQKAQKA